MPFLLRGVCRILVRFVSRLWANNVLATCQNASIVVMLQEGSAWWRGGGASHRLCLPPGSVSLSLIGRDDSALNSRRDLMCVFGGFASNDFRSFEALGW